MGKNKNQISQKVTVKTEKKCMRVYQIALYLPLNFAVKLKLF